MASLTLKEIFAVLCVIFVRNIQATVEYDTYLHAFSRSNIDRPISMSWTDTSKWSKMKDFQKCQIKLIAHGYAERWNMDWRWDWVADLKNEILSNRTKENYCVIAIDWERGAREVNFITAVTNADIAGLHLADFIRSNLIDPSRLHCIGFSLGAHLCAYASNNYYFLSERTSRFARITGLDPSGPLLRKASVDKRLSSDDADFVDCIHTSSTFGLQEKSGHMDFFPDGGKSNSRGCEKLIKVEDEPPITNSNRIKRLLFNKNKKNNDLPKKNLIEKLRDGIGKLNPLKKAFLNIHAYIGCNHLRSPHFFISSVNQCAFRAKRCSSWSDYQNGLCNDSIDNDRTYPRMGFYADRSDSVYLRGNASFYLKTTAAKPYCSTQAPTPNNKTKNGQSKFSKLKKKISSLFSN